MQNSKVNTVLLVILIILVAIGLWFMMSKKDVEESAGNVKDTSSQSAGTVSENQNQNENMNSNTSAAVPALKQYGDTQLHFSYAANATVKKVKDVLQVSVGANDPYAENIGYYVVEMPYTLNEYRQLAPEKYGTTTFEVYQALESGTKLYIVRNARQSIIVEVPFSADRQGTAKYIDLASISL